MITASTSLLALTQLPAIVSLAISTGSVPLSTAFDAAVTVNDPFSSSIKAVRKGKRAAISIADNHSPCSSVHLMQAMRLFRSSP